MSKRIHKRRYRNNATAELNITAFMNLMVVLVPFLLITAVFSQVTILKMNLPAPGDDAPDDKKKPPVALELIFQSDRLIINDRQSGPLTSIPKTKDGYDYQKVNQYLTTIKAKFPDVTSLTILSLEETTYDDIIQAMDAARYTEQIQQGSLQTDLFELFPDVSIGSAGGGG